jgi:hypothetical protein
MTDHEHTTDDDRCDCAFTPAKVVSRADGPDWEAVIHEGEDGRYGIELAVGGGSRFHWPYDNIEAAQEAVQQVLLDPVGYHGNHPELHLAYDES